METVPQSWKRRGNGRETNGKYASKGAVSVPPSRLAPKQLVGAVAEISCSNDTFVAIDAQTREGIEKAQVTTTE